MERPRKKETGEAVCGNFSKSKRPNDRRTKGHHEPGRVSAQAMAMLKLTIPNV
jgi:hypothetical protein